MQIMMKCDATGQEELGKPSGHNDEVCGFLGVIGMPQRVRWRGILVIGPGLCIGMAQHE
jgi:hypothetical protein